jgi:hypothetical protein
MVNRIYTKIIKSCYMCPEYVDTPRECFCNKNNKDLDRRTNSIIPEWCPLPKELE